MLNRRRFLASGAAAAAGTAALATQGAPTAEALRTTDAVTVLPSDPRYADLVVGNNSRWVGRPESVRLVTTTAQVVRAVQEAVSAGKRISVRGGGHCYADFVFNPAVQVVIDTSQMTAVSYDEDRKAFSVEAGATLLRVYESLYKGWGVTIPGGMCYSVGMGGHISGGGYGMLSRRHGLTVDHLQAIEVVTVDASGRARAVIATRESNDPNRELWWAHTGGGGGNFGIVTRYWFRTPGSTGSDPAQQLIHPPREVLVSGVGLPWSSLTPAAHKSLVRKFGAFHARNNTPDSPYAALCSFLMMNHKSNGSIGLLTQIDAGVPNAERLLQDYLTDLTADLDIQPLHSPAGELGPLPEFFTPQRLPWLSSVKLLGTSNPTLTNPTLRGHHKSAYLRQGLTDDQIAAMYRHLTREDHHNPASMVVLLSYGGKINSVRSDATASAQRDSLFKGLFQSFWGDPDDDAVNLAWTRDVFRDVFASTGGYPVPTPTGQTDGCYINYPDSDITDPAQNRSGVPWHTLYYKDNYPRLQRVKAAYDPRNIFRHSQSIGLPS
ncbi:FAD-binding oxidoreductase [Kribbella sp. NBC_00382]|uniref:FAD-binding oxidoreductase n=1 Tax=Kribbella sp. NBC_00382 TaxID=2975967 RepID=UPI002E1B618D